MFQTKLQTCGMVCVFYHDPVTEHHIAWTWSGASWVWVITLQSQIHSNHEQCHSPGSVAETLPSMMAEYLGENELASALICVYRLKLSP